MNNIFRQVVSFFDFVIFILLIYSVITMLKKGYKPNRYQRYEGNFLGTFIIVIFCIIYIIVRVSN